MLNIVLYEPEIAPNTGNIIRLCANTGCQLHLIEPMGFDWQDKKLRRAGLDYHEFAAVQRHKDWSQFTQWLEQRSDAGRVFAFTTKASTYYHETSFKRGDFLLFGPETRGLPNTLLDSLDSNCKLRLPMMQGSRSLNLSNSVAVATYEACRQIGFDSASWA